MKPIEYYINSMRQKDYKAMWEKVTHSYTINFLAGLIFSIVIVLIGGKIGSFSGSTGFGVLEKMVTSLALGVTIGQDIGEALDDEEEGVLYVTLGFFVGIAVAFVNYIGVNEYALFLSLPATAIVMLHYTGDIENLKMDRTYENFQWINKLAEHLYTTPPRIALAAVAIRLYAPPLVSQIAASLGL